MVGHVLSVLILTEDSSPSAHDTLVPLARKLLQFVDRHARSNRIHFEPVEPEARLAVRANVWRSWKAPNPRDERSIRILRRTLATKVLEKGPPGYVLFHFDGDCSWSARELHENAHRLESFSGFIESIRPAIQNSLRERNLPLDDAAMGTYLRRICAVVPFYSIESWLYQNTEQACRMCQQRCGKHVQLIRQWERNRELLDEVVKPKQQLCIGSEENRALAETLTHQLADDLYLLEQSFHATVERLQSCPGLADALRATWADDSGSATRS